MHIIFTTSSLSNMGSRGFAPHTSPCYESWLKPYSDQAGYHLQDELTVQGYASDGLASFLVIHEELDP